MPGPRRQRERSSDSEHGGFESRRPSPRPSTRASLTPSVSARLSPRPSRLSPSQSLSPSISLRPAARSVSLSDGEDMPPPRGLPSRRRHARRRGSYRHYEDDDFGRSRYMRREWRDRSPARGMDSRSPSPRSHSPRSPAASGSRRGWSLRPPDALRRGRRHVTPAWQATGKQERSPTPTPSPSPRRPRIKDEGDDGPNASGVNAIPLGKKRAPGETVSYPKEEENTLRVWVTHRDCAKVIGRGGLTMRKIEAKSVAKLKVQPDKDMTSQKERFVDITGTEVERQAALKLLLEIVRYCREDGDSGEVLKNTRKADSGTKEADGDPLVVEVRPEDVGRVLGRRGDVVKVIESESQAKIEVDKKTGELEVFGDEKQQQAAIKLILDEVPFAKLQDGTILKEDARSRTAGKAGTKIIIHVKDAEAGKVIGRGGEVVHEIMRKTGTDIKIQKVEDMKADGTRERQIRIIGEKERQDEALKLILAEVTWARGADGMIKEPPEGEPRKRRKPRETVGEAMDLFEDEKDRPPKRHPPPPKGNIDKSSGGLWVCATCGGDHRTKECPHAQAFLCMGMQIGMQMGMQASGMAPPGAPPLPPIPGMPSSIMGMPGMPPGMPGMPRPRSPRPRSPRPRTGQPRPSVKQERPRSPPHWQSDDRDCDAERDCSDECSGESASNLRSVASGSPGCNSRDAESHGSPSDREQELHGRGPKPTTRAASVSSKDIFARAAAVGINTRGNAHIAKPKPSRGRSRSRISGR